MNIVALTYKKYLFSDSDSEPEGADAGGQAGVNSVARLTRLASPFHVPRVMAASSQNQVGSSRLIINRQTTEDVDVVLLI